MRKRTTLIAALLLAGGAIVNIAVAWGCGLNNGFGPSRDSDQNDMWWSMNAPSSFVSAREKDQSLTVSTVGHVITQWPVGAFAVHSRFLVQRRRVGWPLLALESSHWFDSETNTTIHKHAWNSSLPTGERNGIALQPLWPGFAINTVFNAVILCGIFAAPFALRRRKRIKRGLCPKCAYPVGANDVCTECGATVRPHATRA